MKKKGNSLVGGSKVTVCTLAGVRGGAGSSISPSGAAALSSPVTGVPGLSGSGK